MKTKITVFPRIIARSDYFLFRAKRRRLLEGRRLFPILLTGSRALKIYIYILFFLVFVFVLFLFFFFFFFFFQKLITSNKLNMGFSSVPNLVPWLVFRVWIVTDLAGSGTASSWQGGDKRKRWYGKRGKGGRLFEGGDYFDISFKGGRLFEEICQKMKICFQKPKQNKTTTKKAKKRLFLRESNPRPSTCNGCYVVGCFAVLCVITLKELRYLSFNIFILL